MISVSAISMPKPSQAHIVALGARQELDRGDAEVAQDLRAEADLAPFLLARDRLRGFPRHPRLRAVALVVADADRTLAQVDDDAALGFRHVAHDAVQRLLRAEDVGDHAFGMETHGNVDAVADVAEDDGKMVHRVPGQR
jgi:hypothetical protein